MKTLNTLFAFFILSGSIFSQNVSQLELQKIAENFLQSYSMHSKEISSVDSYQQNGKIQFHILNLSPQGYLIVSDNKNHFPVIAYSFSNNYLKSSENPLQQTILADLMKREKSNELYNQLYIDKNRKEWNRLLSQEKTSKSSTLTWPEAGSTSTDGWVDVQWFQGAPYNNVCPMDPVTSQRSVAGCPSVAMAQILHFQKTTNGTSFTDEDDYFHNYSGRQYYIDDDFEELDFLSFPEMNENLLSLQTYYDNNEEPTDLEVASLVFACGVACKQVYSSSISGTFGVHQAADAYEKFNFSSAELLYPDAENLYGRMQFNMRHALPVHLAVVDEAGTVGHNVVLDGWDENDFYHTNFGWGGTYDGWYHIPADLPYALTVIEGVVLDIHYENLQNSAPESDDINAFCSPYSSLSLNSFYFTDACFDAELDTICKIKIIELPSSGSLSFNGNPVNINQEINITDVDLIEYNCSETQPENDFFVFQIHDGFVYSENAHFNINLDYTSVIGLENEQYFRIYPNPANEFFNIQILKEGPTQMRLIDIMGNEIIHHSFENSELNIKIDMLSKGVYFVEVKNNGNSYLEKVVVNK